jgi:hypothetical protein
LSKKSGFWLILIALTRDKMVSPRTNTQNPKEDEMFSRVIKAIKPSGRTSFDAYIGNLSKSGNQGVPTADEARKDFAASAKAAAFWRGY